MRGGNEPLRAFLQEQERARELPVAVPYMALPPGVQPAMQSVVQHPPAPQWRPISEAPKDGTDVLVCGNPLKGERESVWIDHYEIAQSDRSVHDTHAGWPISVTHWMPLPAPPGAEAP